MVDIDRFFDMLTEVCDELPDEFFNELHQGVVLSENIKYSPYAHGADSLEREDEIGLRKYLRRFR